MSREVVFDENEKCDICGELGAFDFYGDIICQKCIDKNKHDNTSEDVKDDSATSKMAKAPKNNMATEKNH